MRDRGQCGAVGWDLHVTGEEWRPSRQKPGKRRYTRGCASGGWMGDITGCDDSLPSRVLNDGISLVAIVSNELACP